MLRNLFESFPKGKQRYFAIALVSALAVSIPAIGIPLRLKVQAYADANLPGQVEVAPLQDAQAGSVSAVPTSAAQKESPIKVGDRTMSSPGSVPPSLAPGSGAAGNSPAAQGSAQTSLALPNADAYPQEELTASGHADAQSVLLHPAETSYGHLPYSEADPLALVEIGKFRRGSYERTERLDQEAALAFANMVADAQSQGIALQPISGFRSVADQQDLFEDQVARKGSVEAAADYSAPPGHSEHHTGFAVDIGDANVPEADLKHDFENTPAYGWLLANAADYGFEQSFPKNNAQGVTFEPWHWRFVGSARSGQVFAIARQQYPVP